MHGAIVSLVLLAGLSAGGGPVQLQAQVIQGTVMDEADGRPVPAVLVAVQDRDGRQRAAALSDSVGRYVLRVPGGGDYHLVAEGFGIDVFRSHLLAITERPEPYELDILVRRVPIPIAGIEVTVERRMELERSLRHFIGLSPASLRVKPIHRADIVRQVVRGNGLPDLLRWSSVPGLVVAYTADGPCFRIRGQCAPVYLNDVRMAREWGDVLPIELAEVIVVLMPRESIRYPAGAILLYTAAWIG